MKILNECGIPSIFYSDGLMWVCLPVNFTSSLTPRSLLERPNLCVPDLFPSHKLLRADSQTCNCRASKSFILPFFFLLQKPCFHLVHSLGKGSGMFKSCHWLQGEAKAEARASGGPVGPLKGCWASEGPSCYTAFKRKTKNKNTLVNF